MKFSHGKIDTRLVENKRPHFNEEFSFVENNCSLKMEKQIRESLCIELNILEKS